MPSLHQLAAPVKRLKYSTSLCFTALVYRCLCGALCGLGAALPLSLADFLAPASTFSLADLLGASCLLQQSGGGARFVTPMLRGAPCQAAARPRLFKT